VHRTGDLYGHFQTLEQQKETATLGMWIFLVTEVLFFGGLVSSLTTIKSQRFSTDLRGPDGHAMVKLLIISTTVCQLRG